MGAKNSTNPKTADGVLLRQELFIYAVGRQLVEAHTLYYTDSRFTIDADLLREFIHSPLTAQTRIV
jgi:hypothetical protein